MYFYKQFIVFNYLNLTYFSNIAKLNTAKYNNDLKKKNEDESKSINYIAIIYSYYIYSSAINITIYFIINKMHEKILRNKLLLL